MDAEEIRAASRRKRAERKLAQQRAVAGGVWTRCLYKVPGKERYCAQHRSKLSTKYCGTHMGETEEKGRRVPCPVDPNHTVFEHQLAAHAKICNLTILQARMEAQPYYSKGVNSGPPLSEEGEDKEQEDKAEGGGDASDADAAFDETFLLDLISRVAAAHRDLVGEIPTEVLDHIPEVQPLHRTRTEDGTGFRKGRHVLQHASLVGHLVKRGLAGPDNEDDSNNSSSGTGRTVSHPRVLHVEMGAGKGALGQSIATAFPGAEVTMVERSSVRRKAENRLDGVSARVRIDIRDLNMAGLPSLAPCGENAQSGGRGGGGGRPVVAVAKHLCGVATDLALRAMLTLSDTEKPIPLHERGTGGVDGGGGGGGTAAVTAASRVGGVAVATCCHHVCNWRDYAGREFLSRQGFKARDFDAMRRISAWISLEPDAGTRKNNKYPDEVHPAAAAAAAADFTPMALPPPFFGKTLAAAAPPTIAEEDVADDGDVEYAAADAAVSTIPERPEKTVGNHQPGGVGAEDHLVRVQHWAATSEGGRQRRPGGGTNEGIPSSLGAASPPPPSPTTAPTLPPSRSPAGAPQASLPPTPAAAAAVTSPRTDLPAARNAADGGGDDDDDDDDHRQSNHAPPPVQVTPADAARTTPPLAAGVAAAVVAARVPKPLLALGGLTPAEKARAARECKRLIDRGRRAFIEERLGLASEVVHFVGREVTPENALLLGFRREGDWSG